MYSERIILAAMVKTVIKEEKKVTCIFLHQYAIMFISGDANERSNSVARPYIQYG